MERGAANLESVGARSDDSKRVGAWSGDAKKARSAEWRQSMERGATMSKRVGAWSGDAKKGRSAERSLPLAPLHSCAYCLPGVNKEN